MLAVHILIYGVLCVLVSGAALAPPFDTRSHQHSSALAKRADVIASLAQGLSSGASISYDISSAPRWTEYGAPSPYAIVNIATEEDVQVVVQHCLKHDIAFLAQNGAHGWIKTFDLDATGIIINLRGLNKTSFNSDRTEARVEGGTLIKEVVDQAYANDAQVVTGNCNCVGTLGAGLGGGYGHLMGLQGFTVDNILSMNVVLANGSMVVVTEKDADLWWALKGAAPNFGIVTSVTMKSYPVPQSESKAWLGSLFFTEDKLEKVVQGIQDLRLKPQMSIILLFATNGAPKFEPILFVMVFYYGSETEGRAAFKSIFDIGPIKDTTSELPYDQWNTAVDGFCTKGGRKPSFGVGSDQIVPETWRSIWNSFADFVKLPGTGYSSVVVECYSLEKAQEIGSATSSFANRNVRFQTVAIPWYTDARLDARAEAFGSYTRDLVRKIDGYEHNQTYINFAAGDEANEVVYGASLERLRLIKARHDPQNVFRHWFPIEV